MPDMVMQFKTFPFELKASDDGGGFEGIVSPFFNIDSTIDIVDDQAFDMDLAEFLADGFIGGLNHDWDNPIGTPQAGTKVIANGLLLKANVIDTAHGQDVRKLLKAGVVKKLSIGYQTLGAEFLETQDDVMRYWETKGYKPSSMDMARAARGNVRLLTRVKLFEGSPVTVPANDLATISAVKAAAMQSLLHSGQSADDACKITADYDFDSLKTERDFEGVLREAGFSREASSKFVFAFKAAFLQREAGGDDEAASPLTSETVEAPGEHEEAGSASELAQEPEPAPIAPEIPEKRLRFILGGRNESCLPYVSARS